MNEQHLKKAIFGHHLVMTNISIFHLLIPILAFSTDYIREVILCSFFAAIAMSIWVAKGAKHNKETELISSHWKKAWQRSRYLLASYCVSACVMGLGWVLTSTQTDPQMQKILLTTFIPLATVPTLLTVIVVLVLQTVTITRAKQGLEPNNRF
mgnify:CR=1 FL=1